MTNTRYQPGEAAGLTIDQLRRLKLEWAYGFDGETVALRSPRFWTAISLSEAPAA